MRRYISQMLLDFLHLAQAETWLVGLIIHFEVLNLFELILSLPLHRLRLLFRLIRLYLLMFSFTFLFEWQQAFLVL